MQDIKKIYDNLIINVCKLLTRGCTKEIVEGRQGLKRGGYGVQGYSNLSFQDCKDRHISLRPPSVLEYPVLL